jgi:hypothetical protein
VASLNRYTARTRLRITISRLSIVRRTPDSIASPVSFEIAIIRNACPDFACFQKLAQPLKRAPRQLDAGLLEVMGQISASNLSQMPREANCLPPSREHREKSVGINLRKPPEIACDVTRRTLSFEWKSTQIVCIMTRCKLLVPGAICAVLIGGAGVVWAYSGEELAKDAKVTLSELENSVEGPHAD